MKSFSPDDLLFIHLGAFSVLKNNFQSFSQLIAGDAHSQGGVGHH